MAFPRPLLPLRQPPLSFAFGPFPCRSESAPFAHQTQLAFLPYCRYFVLDSRSILRYYRAEVRITPRLTLRSAFWLAVRLLPLSFEHSTHARTLSTLSTRWKHSPHPHAHQSHTHAPPTYTPTLPTQPHTLTPPTHKTQHTQLPCRSLTLPSSCVQGEKKEAGKIDMTECKTILCGAQCKAEWPEHVDSHMLFAIVTPKRTYHVSGDARAGRTYFQKKSNATQPRATVCTPC